MGNTDYFLNSARKSKLHNIHLVDRESFGWQAGDELHNLFSISFFVATLQLGETNYVDEKAQGNCD